MMILLFGIRVSGARQRCGANANVSELDGKRCFSPAVDRALWRGSGGRWSQMGWGQGEVRSRERWNFPLGPPAERLVRPLRPFSMTRLGGRGANPVASPAD